MAFRTSGKFRSMLNRLGGTRPFASATAAVEPPKNSFNPDLTPVYMVGGLIMVVALFGGHTMKQNLVHSPAVKVTKKRRENIADVDDPDAVVASADKYINKSWFRHIAHIQESKHPTSISGRPNPFTSPRNAETLKSVGIDPSSN